MQKKLNYKKIFKDIVEHKNNNIFMIDFGGDQASISIFAFSDVMKILGINKEPRVNNLVQLSSATEKEFSDKFNIGINWLYPKPSKKLRKLIERFKDVMNVDVKRELKQGYISGGKGSYFIDEWGVKWKRSAYYFEMVEHPLKGGSLEEIKNYKFPDPTDSLRVENLKKDLENCLNQNENFVISLSQSYGGILETALWLRGFTDFYIDIATNNKECRYLLDKIKDYFKEWNRNYVKAIEGKCDIIAIGDDYGMQDRMLLAPELWRKQIKPRYKELISDIKDKYTEIKWFHHSCGSIYPIIRDLIDIGVDILNPIQPTAKDMKPEILKKEYGNEITFHGGIDVQNLLPFKNPTLIREEVVRIIEILSRNGGLIIAPSHNIQANTPTENILAFYETAHKYFLKYIN